MKLILLSLLVGHGADTASSWGQYERNPILGPRFAGKAFAIQSAAVAGVGLVEWRLYKKHPKSRPGIVAGNLAFGGVAARNWTSKGRQ